MRQPSLVTRVTVAAVLCAIASAPSQALGRQRRTPPTNSYTLTPTVTDAPLLQGGIWLQGRANGVDYSDVYASSTLVYGTNYNGNAGGTPYNDSAAILRGTWGADQDVTCTVHTVNQDTADNHNQEVEIRLRSNIGTKWSTGYEALWRAASSSAYCGLVRWNGLVANNSDFTGLDNSGAGHACTAPGLSDGYQVRAAVVGTTFTMYQRANAGASWTTNFTYDTSTGHDGVYDSSTPDTKTFTGNPGIGFWNRQTGTSDGTQSGPGASTANTDYGFTSCTFTAA